MSLTARSQARCRFRQRRVARTARPAPAGHAPRDRGRLSSRAACGNFGRDARQRTLCSHAAAGGPAHRERHRVRHPGPTPVRGGLPTALAGLAPGGGAAPGGLRTPRGSDRAVDDAVLRPSGQQRSRAVCIADRVWLRHGRLHRDRSGRDPAQECPEPSTRGWRAGTPLALAPPRRCWY